MDGVATVAQIHPRCLQHVGVVDRRGAGRPADRRLHILGIDAARVQHVLEPGARAAGAVLQQQLHVAVDASVLQHPRHVKPGELAPPLGGVGKPADQRLLEL